jgi:anaerobic magnesium-protoporphyrin IX monomethyl ester cyclase
MFGSDMGGYRLGRIRVRAPRFLLLYPPLQFAPGEVAKPDGSLSLTYLAGALRNAGYEVRILDCAVGPEDSPLQDSFLNVTPLPSGLRRVGMPVEAILAVAASYDAIGLSSIFTPQTTACLDLIRQIRAAYPEKLIMAGGVNARSLRRRFYASGVDLIATSEAEETIVRVGRGLEGKEQLSAIPGIAFLDESGEERVTKSAPVLQDLDQLPFPAWDLLPLRQYWKISRPHGGNFTPGKTIRYASLQTSRGCPFHCEYCHISLEQADSPHGHIGRFRTKSVERVCREFETLKKLGVEHIYLEDDSLFAKKRRAAEIFGLVKGMGFNLLDVNGINICHLHAGEKSGLRVDTEFIGTLAAAGFTFLTLPFESAVQRIIDKYASSKWKVSKVDAKKLIEACADAGIQASGNYMMGYPDESPAEIFSTIEMARRHVDCGLDYALFFAVVPFPGSALFNNAIRDGHLDSDFNTDEMRWTKSIMRNMLMDPTTLEHVRQLAWLLVNRPDYVKYKRGMTMPDERAIAEAVH